MMPAANISPFDLSADTYDEQFTRSKIGLLQRHQVWETLTPLLQSCNGPLNILEINCGTGEDAIRMAKLGHQVTATDASANMIELAKQKAYRSATVPFQPEFITASFNQLRGLSFPQRFDLVVSNFGGLNCIAGEDIARLGRVLSDLVTPQGKLLLVLLSKCCLWEIAYYAATLQFSKAFRRMKKSTPFNVDEQTMPIYYYSPRSLSTLLEPAFNCSEVTPVGLFVPPSYLEAAFSKRPGLLDSLAAWEKAFGFPIFSPFADHYCMTLIKNDL